MVAPLVFLRGTQPDRKVDATASTGACDEHTWPTPVPWKMALIVNMASSGLVATVRVQMPAVTGAERSGIGGVYIALIYCSTLASFLALAFSQVWRYRASPLWVGWLTGVVGAVACVLSGGTDIVFMAGCILVGTASGISYCLSLFYSMASQSNRGSRGGLHEAALASGAAMIPYVGGVVATSSWADLLIVWRTGVPHLVAGAMLALLSAAAMIYGLVARSRARGLSRLGPVDVVPRQVN